jgi:ferredoxin
VNEEGLPSQKLCPRDAIERKAIGWVDPDDPANNFYEYIIDEEKCNGCGRCVMGCKEPAGLGSITLEVRYEFCLDCNRCSIAIACPDEAYYQETQFTSEEAGPDEDPEELPPTIDS